MGPPPVASAHVYDAGAGYAQAGQVYSNPQLAHTQMQAQSQAQAQAQQQQGAYGQYPTATAGYSR